MTGFSTSSMLCSHTIATACFPIFVKSSTILCMATRCPTGTLAFPCLTSMMIYSLSWYSIRPSMSVGYIPPSSSRPLKSMSCFIRYGFRILLFMRYPSSADILWLRLWRPSAKEENDHQQQSSNGGTLEPVIHAVSPLCEASCRKCTAPYKSPYTCILA